MSSPAIAHAPPVPHQASKAAASGRVGPAPEHGDVFGDPRLRRPGLAGSAGNP